MSFYRKELLGGELAGVDPLKLRLGPEPAAEPGGVSRISEPCEGCRVELLLDLNSRSGGVFGVTYAESAVLGWWLSMYRSSAEGSLEWRAPILFTCNPRSRDCVPMVFLDFLAPGRPNQLSRSSSFSSQKLSHAANIGRARNSTGKNCPKFQRLSSPSTWTP